LVGIVLYAMPIIIAIGENPRNYREVTYYGKLVVRD